MGIWVTNALIMLPLALLGSSLATMSPRVGLDTTLTLPHVSMTWSPFRLQGVLGQLVRQMLPGHLTSASWHVAIPQGRTEEQTNTPQATVIFLFHT